MKYIVFPLSEDSIIIQFGTIHQNLKAQIHDVQKAMNKILSNPFQGFRELVPAYNTLTIYYDPYVMNDYSPYERVKNQIEQILHTHVQIPNGKKRYFELPVCYEAIFAPDMEELAISKGINSEEIIRMHTKMIYDVVFIGFSPGFPFLAGLDEKLHFPRKTTPRLKVEQGSVGIAGNQTGIYPTTSPGGWQIIGRTPVKLFNVHKHHPTLLKTGDQIKFYPISQKEFIQWEDKQWE